MTASKLIPTLDLSHETTPVPFDNNLRKHNVVDQISRNLKKMNKFPPKGAALLTRRGLVVLTGLSSSLDSRSYVLTYLGPYIGPYLGPYLAALFSLCGLPYFPFVGCPIFPSGWIKHVSAGP